MVILARWRLAFKYAAAFTVGFFVSLALFSPKRPSTDYLRERKPSPDTKTAALTELFPRPDSFYLLETSGRAELGLVDLCSVESAALHHPNNSVYVLMTSDFIDWENGRFEGLLQYKNVHIRYLNFESFLRGTPVENLWNDNLVQRSTFLVSHLSDVLRFLVLFRSGGTYLDMDQIVLRTFPNTPNFLGRDSVALAAGVLRFQFGHPILTEMMAELALTFDGADWGANGPKLMARVLRRFCTASAVSPEHCMGVRVFDPEAFYPLHWTNWTHIFDPASAAHVLSTARHSYSLHLWGRKSRGTAISKKMASAFTVLAEKHCPVTYSAIPSS